MFQLSVSNDRRQHDTWRDKECRILIEAEVFTSRMPNPDNAEDIVSAPVL